MIDWLVVWGVTQATGLVFKPILEDLTTEAAKDYSELRLWKMFIPQNVRECADEESW
ncbi:MAG: hypothetical protein F6K09_32725 [Merismopedia sp. SIO2A8]|nr:hypothetical protein [Merismopedia sp. SIO2A8]